MIFRQSTFVKLNTQLHTKKLHFFVTKSVSQFTRLLVSNFELKMVPVMNEFSAVLFGETAAPKSPKKDQPPMYTVASNIYEPSNGLMNQAQGLVSKS